MYLTESKMSRYQIAETINQPKQTKKKKTNEKLSRFRTSK